MAVGGKDRWWRRLFGAKAGATLDADRTDLIVVASCFDDVEACSATLDRAEAWTASKPAVLRHHLLLPAEAIEDAVAVAAQDGYSASASGPPAEASPTVPDVDDGRPLVLQRVQILDALHCSQERSRMAGLAQRRGGAVLGWDALQPDPGGGSAH